MATTIDVGVEPGRGRQAATPSAIPLDGWKDILWRVWSEISEDRITLIAAGATFYLLLALFPALAAFVSIYGVVADPVTIADHIAFLGGLLPSGGVDLIENQLRNLAAQNEAALSFGFIFGLAVALWSANNGIKTLFEAMNVVYDETEKRSFIALNLLSLLFTLGAIVIGVLFIAGVGVVPAVLAFAGLGGATEFLISVLRWPILLAAAALGISGLYRYGPSRERAKWRWVTWGSGAAAALWLLGSLLFTWYLANFADYNATYGSLGAVIGFMMWTWISVVIILAGAELNSEMEHQTARDSTTGPEAPMGVRGATMADTLGASRHAPFVRGSHEQPRQEPLEFSGQTAGEHVPPRRPPDRLGTLLGFALPVMAVATRLALDEWDRRRGAARIPPVPASRSAQARVQLAQVLDQAHMTAARAQAFLTQPAARELLARARRAAGDATRRGRGRFF